MLHADNQVLISALEVLRNHVLQIDIYLLTYLLTLRDCFIWHSGRQKKEGHARGGVTTSLTGLGKAQRLAVYKVDINGKNAQLVTTVYQPLGKVRKTI